MVLAEGLSRLQVAAHHEQGPHIDGGCSALLLCCMRWCHGLQTQAVAASPSIALAAEVAWSNIFVSIVAELSHVLPVLTVRPCVGYLAAIALASRALWQHGEICVFCLNRW